MAKLGNPKNAFWEAFLLAAIVFIFGLFLGVAFESSRAAKLTGYYAQSEVSLMDAFVFNNLAQIEDVTCKALIGSNILFADRIYDEALLLEKYEASGKITDEMRVVHKKYDLLRAFLWINIMKTRERCTDHPSLVVYLYEFEIEDLTKKATHTVWSRILFDLKQEKGNDIILVPVAVDSELTSLNSLLSQFNISEFPAVIINDKHVINELTSVEDLERYL